MGGYRDDRSTNWRAGYQEYSKFGHANVSVFVLGLQILGYTFGRSCR